MTATSLADTPNLSISSDHSPSLPVPFPAGKSVEEVEALLNDGVQTMEELKERGFLTGINYAIEVQD